MDLLCGSFDPPNSAGGGGGGGDEFLCIQNYYCPQCLQWLDYSYMYMYVFLIHEHYECFCTKMVEMICHRGDSTEIHIWLWRMDRLR